MVQNVAWNQYVLFYFRLFTGRECCGISMYYVYWYRMLPGISMYYCTFDCLLMLPGISMYYCTFDCLLVQNVAWNQYVLFYF